MKTISGLWSSVVFLSGLSVTIITSVGAGVEIADLARRLAVRGDWPALVYQLLFAVIVAFLVYGNIVYQLTRHAHYSRLRAHRPVELDRLRQLHHQDAPRLAVLVPTYKEEEAVVLQTLLSAALLEYPTKQVVLLIDDTPGATSTEDRENLERMRRLPERVQHLLRPAATLFAHELQTFLGASRPSERLDGSRLGELFALAADHIVRIGAEVDGTDHASAFFRDRIIDPVARDLRASAGRWRNVAPGACSAPVVERELRRILSHFSANLSFFERKAYRNLSHAPNKAMNLNAYIALMGGSLHEVRNVDGSLNIVECGPQEATRSFPDSDYVITLDADSLLLNDYALRLVDFLEHPENARIAIAQTPYSAYERAVREPLGARYVARLTRALVQMDDAMVVRYQSKGRERARAAIAEALMH